MFTMDFIEGLSKYGRFNCILVVVDKLSRYWHFIGLPHPFTVTTMRAFYMDIVYEPRGMSKSIVTDRDHIFTSKFWKEMPALTGTNMSMHCALWKISL